jgi:hypothetical protein
VAVDRELASAERHDGGLGGVRKEKKRGRRRREYLIMALRQEKKMSNPSCDDHLG